MSGIARQFEPQITRSGGAPAQYRYTIRCSDCSSTETFEAAKPTSHNTVSRYFSEHGWLLGRAPSFDVCPSCLARPRRTQETQLTGQRREAKVLDKRSRETADILARHLGKPDELAAEVFRPREARPIQPPAHKAPQVTQSTPAVSPEVEQTLSGMAAEMKNLRSAVELMADQMSQLVVLGGRQIEALAQLAPALAQSTEGVSEGLRLVARAIQTMPHLPQFVTASTSVAESDPALPTQAIDPEPAPVAVPPAPELPRQTKGRRNGKGEAIAREPADIVVKSIADAKRFDRFYTSIRLPREIWDGAGFGPDDRLLLDWSGKALSIERAAEGGVKPKTIGATTVVLQSWKLGNLNFDRLEVTNGGGSRRLTVWPSVDG